MRIGKRKVEENWRLLFKTVEALKGFEVSHEVSVVNVFLQVRFRQVNYQLVKCMNSEKLWKSEKVKVGVEA